MQIEIAGGATATHVDATFSPAHPLPLSKDQGA